jgi:hypothetical protein
MSARRIGAAAAFFYVTRASRNHLRSLRKTSSSGDEIITPLLRALPSRSAGDG